MGELAIMDRGGDTRIMWDSRRPDEVKNAEKQFKDLRKKGYVAYSVTERGDKDEVLQTFDPAAEKIILAPAVAGG